MAQRVFIIGAGRFGVHLATRLCEFGTEVVLADSDEKRIEDLVQDGFHTVQINAEDEDALKQAGVQEADAVVVCIGENMQGSILTTLLLKDLKVKNLVCRAQDARHATVLEKLGADLVLLPSRDMAHRLAERLRDNAHSDRQELCGKYQLAQIRLGSALDGKTLAESLLRERYDINVLLLARPGPDKKLEAHEPAPSLKLALNDVLFISGQRGKINQFERDCGV